MYKYIKLLMNKHTEWNLHAYDIIDNIITLVVTYLKHGYRCGLFRFSCKPLSLSYFPSSSECLGGVSLRASRLSMKKETKHEDLFMLESLLLGLTKPDGWPVVRRNISKYSWHDAFSEPRCRRTHTFRPLVSAVKPCVEN